MHCPPPLGSRRAGFSLVEVVLALGICSFGIVALVGLFSAGVQASKESQDQIQAANLASLLVAVRAASPTNALPGFVIPPLAAAYAATTNLVGYDGMVTNDAAAAAARVVCQSGTNAVTGPNLAQISLEIASPPQAALASPAVKRYDFVTFVPLP